MSAPIQSSILNENLKQAGLQCVRRLNEEELKRLDEVLNHPYSFSPHPSLAEKLGITQTQLDSCFPKFQCTAQEVSAAVVPTLSLHLPVMLGGGGMRYVLGRHSFFDVDQIFYVEPTIAHLKHCKASFFQEKLRKAGAALDFQRKETPQLITSAYISRFKVIDTKEGKPQALFMGSQIEDSYLFDLKTMQGAATFDRFKIGYDGNLYFKEGDQITIQQALQHLSRKLYVLENPEAVREGYLRVIHAQTRAYEVADYEKLKKLLAESLHKDFPVQDGLLTQRLIVFLHGHEASSFSKFIEMFHFLILVRELPPKDRARYSAAAMQALLQEFRPSYYKGSEYSWNDFRRSLVLQSSEELKEQAAAAESKEQAAGEIIPTKQVHAFATLALQFCEKGQVEQLDDLMHLFWGSMLWSWSQCDKVVLNPLSSRHCCFVIDGKVGLYFPCTALDEFIPACIEAVFRLEQHQKELLGFLHTMPIFSKIDLGNLVHTFLQFENRPEICEALTRSGLTLKREKIVAALEKRGLFSKLNPEILPLNYKLHLAARVFPSDDPLSSLSKVIAQVVEKGSQASLEDLRGLNTEIWKEIYNQEISIELKGLFATAIDQVMQQASHSSCLIEIQKLFLFACQMGIFKPNEHPQIFERFLKDASEINLKTFEERVFFYYLWKEIHNLSGLSDWVSKALNEKICELLRGIIQDIPRLPDQPKGDLIRCFFEAVFSSYAQELNLDLIPAYSFLFNRSQINGRELHEAGAITLQILQSGDEAQKRIGQAAAHVTGLMLQNKSEKLKTLAIELLPRIPPIFRKTLIAKSVASTFVERDLSLLAVLQHNWNLIHEAEVKEGVEKSPSSFIRRVILEYVHNDLSFAVALFEKVHDHLELKDRNSIVEALIEQGELVSTLQTSLTGLFGDQTFIATYSHLVPALSKFSNLIRTRGFTNNTRALQATIELLQLLNAGDGGIPILLKVILVECFTRILRETSYPDSVAQTEKILLLGFKLRLFEADGVKDFFPVLRNHFPEELKQLQSAIELWSKIDCTGISEQLGQLIGTHLHCLRQKMLRKLREERLELPNSTLLRFLRLCVAPSNTPDIQREVVSLHSLILDDLSDEDEGMEMAAQLSLELQQCGYLKEISSSIIPFLERLLGWRKRSKEPLLILAIQMVKNLNSNLSQELLTKGFVAAIVHQDRPASRLLREVWTQQEGYGTDAVVGLKKEETPSCFMRNLILHFTSKKPEFAQVLFDKAKDSLDGEDRFFVLESFLNGNLRAESSIVETIATWKNLGFKVRSIEIHLKLASQILERARKNTEARDLYEFQAEIVRFLQHNKDEISKSKGTECSAIARVVQQCCKSSLEEMGTGYQIAPLLQTVIDMTPLMLEMIRVQRNEGQASKQNTLTLFAIAERMLNEKLHETYSKDFNGLLSQLFNKDNLAYLTNEQIRALMAAVLNAHLYDAYKKSWVALSQEKRLEEGVYVHFLEHLARNPDESLFGFAEEQLLRSSVLERMPTSPAKALAFLHLIEILVQLVAKGKAKDDYLALLTKVLDPVKTALSTRDWLVCAKKIMEAYLSQGKPEYFMLAYRFYKEQLKDYEGLIQLIDAIHCLEKEDLKLVLADIQRWIQVDQVMTLTQKGAEKFLQRVKRIYQAHSHLGLPFIKPIVFSLLVQAVKQLNIPKSDSVIAQKIIKGQINLKTQEQLKPLVFDVVQQIMTIPDDSYLEFFIRYAEMLFPNEWAKRKKEIEVLLKDNISKIQAEFAQVMEASAKLKAIGKDPDELLAKFRANLRVKFKAQLPVYASCSPEDARQLFKGLSPEWMSTKGATMDLVALSDDADKRGIFNIEAYTLIRALPPECHEALTAVSVFDQGAKDPVPHVNKLKHIPLSKRLELYLIGCFRQDAVDSIENTLMAIEEQRINMEVAIIQTISGKDGRVAYALGEAEAKQLSYLTDGALKRFEVLKGMTSDGYGSFKMHPASLELQAMRNSQALLLAATHVSRCCLTELLGKLQTGQFERFLKSFAEVQELPIMHSCKPLIPQQVIEPLISCLLFTPVLLDNAVKLVKTGDFGKKLEHETDLQFLRRVRMEEGFDAVLGYVPGVEEWPLSHDLALKSAKEMLLTFNEEEFQSATSQTASILAYKTALETLSYFIRLGGFNSTPDREGKVMKYMTAFADKAILLVIESKEDRIALRGKVDEAVEMVKIQIQELNMPSDSASAKAMALGQSFPGTKVPVYIGTDLQALQFIEKKA